MINIWSQTDTYSLSPSHTHTHYLCTLAPYMHKPLLNDFALAGSGGGRAWEWQSTRAPARPSWGVRARAGHLSGVTGSRGRHQARWPHSQVRREPSFQACAFSSKDCQCYFLKIFFHIPFLCLTHHPTMMVSSSTIVKLSLHFSSLSLHRKFYYEHGNNIFDSHLLFSNYIMMHLQCQLTNLPSLNNLIVSRVKAVMLNLKNFRFGSVNSTNFSSLKSISEVGGRV